MITGRQIREGRALLVMHASKLASRAKLKIATIHRAESTDGDPPITTTHAEAIRRALESAGVEFTNGDQPGVRLRGPKQGD